MHSLITVVIIQLSPLTEFEEFSVQLVLFKKAYFQLLVLTFMISYQLFYLQSSTVEGILMN